LTPENVLIGQVSAIVDQRSGCAMAECQQSSTT